jgi:hypothetical protein
VRDRAKRTLTLSVTGHIDRMLDRFGMTDAHVSTSWRLQSYAHRCYFRTSP